MQIRRGRQKSTVVTMGIFLLLLLLFRLLLPNLFMSYLNDKLDTVQGYDGSVEDVDLYIWRGSYRIHDLQLKKLNEGIQEPFFQVKTIEFSLDWKLLLKGTLTGGIRLIEPELNFIQGKSPGTSQTGLARNWQNTLADMFPLGIDSLSVYEGTVHYMDRKKTPHVSLNLSEIYAEGSNFMNAQQRSDFFFAELHAEGKTEKEGRFTLQSRLNLLSESQSFRIEVELQQIHLPQLNALLQSYGGFSVKTGILDSHTYAEFRKGSLSGVVTAAFSNLSFLQFQVGAGSPLKLFQDALFAGSIPELPGTTESSSLKVRIPFSGGEDEQHDTLWSAAGQVLKEPFVRILLPEMENRLQFGETVLLRSK